MGGVLCYLRCERCMHVNTPPPSPFGRATCLTVAKLPAAHPVHPYARRVSHGRACVRGSYHQQCRVSRAVCLVEVINAAGFFYSQVSVRRPPSVMSSPATSGAPQGMRVR